MRQTLNVYPPKLTVLLSSVGNTAELDDNADIWEIDLRVNYFAPELDQTELPVLIQPDNSSLDSLPINIENTSKIWMYYKWYCQRFCDRRGLDESIISQFWDENPTELRNALSDECNSNPELFILLIVGRAIDEFYLAREFFSQSYVDPNDPFEDRIDLSLVIQEALSNLANPETNSIAGSVLRNHLNERQEVLNTYLAKYADLLGLIEGSVDLRYRTEGSDIILDCEGNRYQIHEPVPTVKAVAIDGPDKSGKSSVLDLLVEQGFLVVPIVYPDSQGMQSMVSYVAGAHDLGSEFDKIASLMQMIKRSDIRAAERIRAIQMLFVYTRLRMAQSINPLLSIPINTVFDRSLFSNPAGARDIADFCLKLLELNQDGFLPSRIILMDIPIVEGLRRTYDDLERGGKADVFDTTVFREYMRKKYFYKLLAKLFPKLFTVYQTVKSGAKDDVLSRGVPTGLTFNNKYRCPPIKSRARQLIEITGIIKKHIFSDSQMPLEGM